jgi:hypothetical protein
VVFVCVCATCRVGGEGGGGESSPLKVERRNRELREKWGGLHSSFVLTPLLSPLSLSVLLPNQSV